MTIVHMLGSASKEFAYWSVNFVSSSQGFVRSSLPRTGYCDMMRLVTLTRCIAWMAQVLISIIGGCQKKHMCKYVMEQLELQSIPVP